MCCMGVLPCSWDRERRRKRKLYSKQSDKWCCIVGTSARYQGSQVVSPNFWAQDVHDADPMRPLGVFLLQMQPRQAHRDPVVSVPLECPRALLRLPCEGLKVEEQICWNPILYLQLRKIQDSKMNQYSRFKLKSEIGNPQTVSLLHAKSYSSYIRWYKIIPPPPPAPVSRGRAQSGLSVYLVQSFALK